MKSTSRRGSYAVEFALTAPLLLTLLAGIVDVSWYVHISTRVAHATAAGCRIGAYTGLDESPAAAAVEAAKAEWEVAGVEGAPDFEAKISGSAPDVRLQVVADMEYSGFFGYTAMPEWVSHTAVFRMAEQPE